MKKAIIVDLITLWGHDKLNEWPQVTSQRYKLSTSFITVDVDFSQPGWDSVSQISLLQSYYFSPFSYYYTLWKEVTVSSPHTRSPELSSFSLRGEYLLKLFGIILHGKCVSSPFFINSTIYLYKFGLIDIYFELQVKSNTFVFCENCPSFGNS